MSHDEKSTATPSQTDLAFTRESPYGTRAEPTYSGALSFLRRRYRRISTAWMSPWSACPSTWRPPTVPARGLVRARSAPLPPRWPGAGPMPGSSIPSIALNVIDWGDVFFDAGTPASGAGGDPRAPIAQFVAAGVTAADAGRRPFHQLPDPAGAARKARPAVADPLRRPLRYLARQRRPHRPRHHVFPRGAARLRRSRALDPGRHAHAQRRDPRLPGAGRALAAPAWRRRLHRRNPRARRDGNRATSASTSTSWIRPARRAPARRWSAASIPTRPCAWCADLAGLDIVGMDVVEVSPPFDLSELTSLAAASIAQELLCAHASRFPDRG